MSQVLLRSIVTTLIVTGHGCGGDTGSAPFPAAGSVPVGLVRVATGLSFPLFLTAPPGDSARLFIVEKTGKIRIVKDGVLLPGSFLDVSAAVSNGGEQGLLGMAFHPAYRTNGLFVVSYTNTSGDTRISTFRVSSNPDKADPASEQAILSQPQPFANHNGGMVAFGPDGNLYIGLGDGGSGGDPSGNGQNLNTRLAKLLRVEVTGPGSITIPTDNPFVGTSGALGEIWSRGLRNPWRFSFDRSTGDLYIADVGQDRREEVDAVTGATRFGRGLNFGWNRMEGTSCFQPATGCDTTGLTRPVIDYDHSQGCSVTGGYVYRGRALPTLRGTYFYGDYCQGWVRSFRLQASSVTDQLVWPTLAPNGAITSFGEDAAGELYVLVSGGSVYRIVPK